jgi:hypothetical protein
VSSPVRVPHSPRGYVARDAAGRWWGREGWQFGLRGASIFPTAHAAYSLRNSGVYAVYSIGAALDQEAEELAYEVELVGEREGRG